ncbi:tumor protein p63-regulated gene 1 protein [Pimephales promelas]|uniref:tumor protein p63-regulated gene 1 protein n=1 Tax=Pimephales promelas TaxID=90988 RepID=UPI001955F20A|nr:tumor protein p63-regulated gene 1 protein [Pimephales promelas]KAG1940900.1 tumor protein p63-regulated protein [Pimephales promelas]KAG1940902.1 tumor protein p63-regulated protein [Pimephales promelas]
MSERDEETFKSVDLKQQNQKSPVLSEKDEETFESVDLKQQNQKSPVTSEKEVETFKSVDLEQQNQKSPVTMSEREDETFKSVDLKQQNQKSPVTMSEKDEETFNSVDLKPQTQKSPEPDIYPQQSPSETEKPSTPASEAKAETTPSPRVSAVKSKWQTSTQQFKVKKFFVLRPGTLDHGIEDVKSLVDPTEDGAVQSVWLMAEIDHWNNEKERLVLITENTLLVCKYDFIMLHCEQIQKIPLNFIDRISHGTFCFPPNSLLKREGEGVRVFWDKLREPSFTSRWNPFSVDYPFCSFTYHPVRGANEQLGHLCEIQSFREELTLAAQKAHSKNPVPGKANGVLVLNQPILIEAYVGLMSVIGNQNKLGYCLARGNIGF